MIPSLSVVYKMWLKHPGSFESRDIFVLSFSSSSSVYGQDIKSRANFQEEYIDGSDLGGGEWLVSWRTTSSKKKLNEIRDTHLIK